MKYFIFSCKQNDKTMIAQQAYQQFQSMTLEEALNVRVPFGKHQGEQVKELPFNYCEWVRENVQAAFGTEEKFAFLYAISTLFNSDRLRMPDDSRELITNCIIN